MRSFCVCLDHQTSMTGLIANKKPRLNNPGFFMHNKQAYFYICLEIKVEAQAGCRRA